MSCRTFLVTLALVAVLVWTAAAQAATPATPNPMSVHVLDLQTGLPAAGVNVTLERSEEGQWVRLASGSTDKDGRIVALYPDDAALQSGDYRVTFQTGEWFTAHGMDVFYPVVQQVLRVDGSVPHYHVPLLLSSYGYSTYRGS